MNRWVVRAAFLSMVLLTACNDDPTGTIRVDRVEVSPADQVLVVGDSTTLTAVPMTSGGDVVVGLVMWRSLSPTVATVRVSGGTAVVQAKAPGVARIEAESGGRTGFVNVTVVAAPQVATVTLLPTTMVLELDQEASIQAVARTADGAVIAGRAVTWTVTGMGVTVAPDATPGWATVTAHTNGEAVIRATIDGIVGEAEVQVVTTTPPPAQVASVEITPNGFSLSVNHETALQAIAKDAFGNTITGLPVTWVSTVASVASVTPIGVSPFANLLAKTAGTTVIRATVGGVTAEMNFTVTATPPPADEVLYVLFAVGRRGIWANQLLGFRPWVMAYGRNGVIQNPAITWSIEDTDVAVVDADGNVRGLTAGTTVLRATVGGVSGTTLVTVYQATPGPVVYDLTYDWWDYEWHMPPQVGTETWTDAHGVDHEVSLWPTGGALTLDPDGTYERVLTIRGWAHVDGYARVVIDREVVDRGNASIMVGGETGYWMHSETTPGHIFAVVAGNQAGHLVMRAQIGDAPEAVYMLRMRQ